MKPINNAEDCGCDSYSQLSANTGVATISLANPNLNGTGETEVVLTAGESGTTIKSVIIKSVPESILVGSQQGIVRLFISDNANIPNISLYKEIPIPVMPSTPTLSLPIPLYPSFEIMLAGDLKLQPNYKLLASTQFANTFNVIAEGVDWTYPTALPTVCCNFKQETAITGIGMISQANPNYDGSGSIVTVFTADAGSNGSTIKSITVKALQSTHNGMVRFFVSPDGSDYSLMMEVPVPQTQQSGFEPSFKYVVDLDFNLAPGYTIGAATQNQEGFAITVEGVDWVYAS